jgi:hypothetical protein
VQVMMQQPQYAQQQCTEDEQGSLVMGHGTRSGSPGQGQQ